MKRRFTISTLIVVAIYLISAGFSGEDTKYPSGSPGGYSGSPTDGKNCTDCHGGSAQAQAGIITSDIPSSGYISGATYQISVTVSGSGKKGFEVSPQTSSGILLGTLTPGSGTKLVNSNRAVTHSSANTANPAVWTFQWTAPAAGTGPVTFYGAFARTMSTTLLSYLMVQENTLSISEPKALDWSVFPNPVSSGFRLSYTLPSASNVSVCLFNLQGQKVMNIVDGRMESGVHNDYYPMPSGLSCGVYMVKCICEDKTTSKRIVVE